MSWAALQALRDDVNPRGFGVLWDLAHRWMATTPDGDVLVAATSDALRRAIREADGTTTADTATFSAVSEETNEEP